MASFAKTSNHHCHYSYLCPDQEHCLQVIFVKRTPKFHSSLSWHHQTLIFIISLLLHVIYMGDVRTTKSVVSTRVSSVLQKLSIAD